MSQPGNANEVFEITSNELRTVVGDHSGSNTGIFFHRSLDDNFDLGFCHRVAQLPMQHGSGAAVQDRTQVEEGTGNVEVRDVDMPVFMRLQGLKETTPFARGLGIPAL